MDPDFEEWQAAQGGGEVDPDLVEWQAAQATSSSPSFLDSVSNVLQDVQYSGGIMPYLGKKFAEDPVGVLNQTAKGALKGTAGAFTGLADLGGSVVASAIDGSPQLGFPTTEATMKAINEYTSPEGEDNPFARIVGRGTELASNTFGLGGLGQKIKGLGWLAKGLPSTTALSGLGGAAGRSAVEAGIAEQGGGRQLGIELATMTAPSLVRAGAKTAGAIYNKLVPSSTRKTADIIKALSQNLDDSSVLAQSADVGPLPGPSTQTAREEALAAIIKGERNVVGSPVGKAQLALEAVSGEASDLMAMRSKILDEMASPTPSTDFKALRAMLKDVEQRLAAIPKTNTSTVMVGNAQGSIVPTQVTKPNPVFTAVEDLKSANDEASQFYKDMKSAISTDSADIEKIQRAVSNSGAKFINDGVKAKRFAKQFGNDPKATSLARMSIFNEITDFGPGSWIAKINQARPALKNLGMTDEAINGVRDVLAKGSDKVGGATGFITKLMGDKLAFIGATVGGFTGAGWGLVPMAGIARVINSSISKQPQKVASLLSQAMNDANFAAQLSKKATPENIKAAIESFKAAGRNAIMGLSANDEEITNLGTIGLSGEESPTEKKSEVLAPQPVADVESTPKVAPDLVKRVIAQESSFNPKAVGPQTKYGTAKGLMQLLDSTGKEWHEKLGLPGEYDPFNPEQNKAIGEAYLGWLHDQFDGDTKLALAAYNWGIGNLKKLLKQNKGATFDELKYSLPKETRDYVNKITKA